MSRCLNCIRKGETPLQDIYAYNPTYEWTAHKTRVGMGLSYLTIAFLMFYIAITMRDYVMRPPELVSQGDIDLLQVGERDSFSSASLWTPAWVTPTAVVQVTTPIA